MLEHYEKYCHINTRMHARTHMYLVDYSGENATKVDDDMSRTTLKGH